MTKSKVTSVKFHTPGFRPVNFHITERDGNSHFTIDMNELKKDCLAHALAGIFFEALQQHCGAEITEAT